MREDKEQLPRRRTGSSINRRSCTAAFLQGERERASDQERRDTKRGPIYWKEGGAMSAADLLRHDTPRAYISVKKRRNATNAMGTFTRKARSWDTAGTAAAVAIDCFRKVAARSSISGFPLGSSLS